ncbi:MAG: hypothetical protein L0177_02725, partial [Chloroflexi bacterium]|nr:hypothetical protein [Chloroflexota bacterium]
GDYESATSSFNMGTSFVDFFTGIVYFVFGPSMVGGFFAFAFIAFLGSVFAFKAFRVAFPDGNHKLFAILIFFFPTTLYWPNGIGKDALMMFSIGLTSYGAALLLSRGRVWGILPLGLGLLGALYVRPHIAAVLALAVALALLLRGARRSISNPLAAVAMLAIAVVLAWTFINQAVAFLNLEEASIDAGITYIDARGEDISGESGFEPPSVSTPSGVLMAIATTLFRPFLWEANNVQAVGEALAGVALFALITWRFRSILSALRALKSNPYVLFILVFVLTTAAVLIVASNFGTLARTRTMFLPLFFMLLALEPAKREAPSRETETTWTPS